MSKVAKPTFAHQALTYAARPSSPAFATTPSCSAEPPDQILRIQGLKAAPTGAQKFRDGIAVAREAHLASLNRSPFTNFGELATALATASSARALNSRRPPHEASCAKSDAGSRSVMSCTGPAGSK